MIHAMVAADIDGQMQAVGTIVLTDVGMTYSTDDRDLGILLGDIKRNGIIERTGGASDDEEITDEWEKVLVTQEKLDALEDWARSEGYLIWVEGQRQV